MDEAKILMIVKSAEARAAYEEALQKIGVAYDIASSFTEVQQMTVDNAYNGLMIDILTLIRSSKDEKLIAYDCINCYPSLRVKWDVRQKTMNLSPLEQAFSVNTQSTLTCFVEGRCRSFTARSMRRFPRKESFLGLLLSRNGDFDETHAIKTFTANISQGGAFVHTTHRFIRGDAVWLRFVEIPDAEPIRAVVAWSIEWGVCRGISGIGVKFDALSPEQADDIRQMANL